MTNPENRTEKFISFFTFPSGEYLWRTYPYDNLACEETTEGHLLNLEMGFDFLDQPTIRLWFKPLDGGNPSSARISSTVTYWERETCDGYEVPLPATDKLEVEVSYHGLEPTRYYVPDANHGSVTVSRFLDDLRDSNDPDSQGDWSEPIVAEPSDAELIKGMVINSIATAEAYFRVTR